MTTTHIYATKVNYGRDGTRSVTVRCCFCGKNHVYGWPYGNRTIGLRFAHCEKLIIADYFVHPPRGYKETDR